MTDVYRMPIEAQRQIVKNGTPNKQKSVQGDWVSKPRKKYPRILEVTVLPTGDMASQNPTWKKDYDTGMYYCTNAYVIRADRQITARKLKIWSSMEMRYGWEEAKQDENIGNMSNMSKNNYFVMYFHGRWNVIGSMMLPGELYHYLWFNRAG